MCRGVVFFFTRNKAFPSVSPRDAPVSSFVDWPFCVQLSPICRRHNLRLVFFTAGRTFPPGETLSFSFSAVPPEETAPLFSPPPPRRFFQQRLLLPRGPANPLRSKFKLLVFFLCVLRPIFWRNFLFYGLCLPPLDPERISTRCCPGRIFFNRGVPSSPCNSFRGSFSPRRPFSLLAGCEGAIR